MATAPEQPDGPDCPGSNPATPLPLQVTVFGGDAWAENALLETEGVEVICKRSEDKSDPPETERGEFPNTLVFVHIASVFAVPEPETELPPGQVPAVNPAFPSKQTAVPAPPEIVPAVISEVSVPWNGV